LPRQRNRHYSLETNQCHLQDFSREENSVEVSNIFQSSYFYFRYFHCFFSIKKKKFSNKMASGGSGSLKAVFDQYAKFGKTETQLKDKDIRLEQKNIQKMMKDSGVCDSKYTTQLLDNDMARVLGKLTSGGTYAKGM